MTADGERGHRVIPAEHQRDGQGEGDRDENVPAPVATADARRGDAEGGGEHAVHQPGMTAQPEVEGGHGSKGTGASPGRASSCGRARGQTPG